jgi:glycosyltransferase involved in cell wall biosynthesis
MSSSRAPASAEETRGGAGPASGPRVSVLLPVRDGERYLREALDSVLAQTLGDFELVVVDDGSRDGTSAILEGYRDARMRVIRQERLGLVAALRRGLEACQAPYLARMDADDVALPRRLERQVELLDGLPRAALVVPGVAVVDAHGQELERIVLPSHHDGLVRRLLLRNSITHGAVALRRRAVDDVGGYRDDYGANEDYDLWRRLARHWELRAIDEVLYRYRRHPEAVTRSGVDERVASRERLRDELWQDPKLLRHLRADPDRVEARAMVAEAVRRRRPLLCARLVADGAAQIARPRRRASS